MNSITVVLQLPSREKCNKGMSYKTEEFCGEGEKIQETKSTEPRKKAQK